MSPSISTPSSATTSPSRLTNQLPFGAGAARTGARLRSHDQPPVVLRDEPVRHRGARARSSTSSCPTVEMPEPRESRAHRRDRASGARACVRSRPTTSTCATSCGRCSGSPVTPRASTRSATRCRTPTSTTCIELLGHRPDSWLEGEAELERFVLADTETGTHDERARAAVPPTPSAGPDAPRSAGLGDGPPPADPDVSHLTGQ